MFHSGDLHSGIAAAVQQRKAVLCFVRDDTEKSAEWEEILTEDSMRPRIQAEAIVLRIQAGSQEAGFMAPICPVNSTPTIIVIKNAALQANLQAAQVNTGELKSKIESIFGTVAPSASQSPNIPELSEEDVPAETPSEQQPPSAPTSSWIGYLSLPPAQGQFRLPNNAYDALQAYTQELLDAGTDKSEVYEAQLRVLERLPVLRAEAQRLRGSQKPPELSDYARAKLLCMPAAAVKAQRQAVTAATTHASAGNAATQPSNSNSSSTSTSVPQPSSSSRPHGNEYVYHSPTTDELISESQRNQQLSAEAAKRKEEAAMWNKLQHERQKRDREARDRVKAQIAADREERRRLLELRNQTDAAIEAEASKQGESARTAPTKVDIRLQVRTFDGSTLRHSFPATSTFSANIRPWIDSSTSTTTPYNLKLILTPLPTRTIEASEETLPLSDLNISRSCTLVMVPVKGYVESYTSPSGGLIGSALSGGYNLVTGTVGALVGGVRSVLGYGGTEQPANEAPGAAPASSVNSGRMKVHTLADQRVEQMDRRSPNHQLYNGNQLNFEPNWDEDGDRKND